MNILALPGSLRQGSSTYTVINTAISLAGADVVFSIYNGIGSLPHFDDSPTPLPAVAAWHDAVAAADALLICSPEYAFGVPGSLKNALDWLVSSGRLAYKPVALITAATGGDKAHAAMLLTLNVLSTRVSQSLLISFIKAKINDKGELADSGTRDDIKEVLRQLVLNVQTGNIAQE